MGTLLILTWALALGPRAVQAQTGMPSGFWTLKNIRSVGKAGPWDGNPNIRNGTLYTVENGKLNVYDDRDPKAPVRQGQSDPIPLYDINDMAITGSMALIGGDVTDGMDEHGLIMRPQLLVYDLSNPKNPQRIGQLYPNGGDEGHSVKKIIVSGAYAYLICPSTQADTQAMIQQVNIATPLLVTPANSSNLGGHGNIVSLAVSGNWAFALTDDGLVTLDAASLEEKAATPLTWPTGMAVNGNIAYIACQGSSADTDEGTGLVIFDLSQPLKPAQVGQQATFGYVTSIDYAGGIAYLGYSLSSKLLSLYDVSRPQEAQLIGEITTSRTDFLISGVALYNGFFGLSGETLRYTPENTAKIRGLSRAGYRTDYLNAQSRLYTDRTFEYASPMPAAGLQGPSYIVTRNDDKNSNGTDFLRFKIDRAATVYVAYDERAGAVPQWLAGWQETSQRLVTTDARAPRRRLYARHYPAGTVTLGGNLDAGAPATDGISMYGVVIVADKSATEEWQGYR